MLKKMEIRYLRPGMFVTDIGRGWFGHPWKTRSKLLGSQEEIEQLAEYGITEVTVDMEKSTYDLNKPVEPESTPPQTFMAPAAPKPHPRPDRSQEPVSQVELELPKAAKAYTKALDTTRALVAACRMNKKIEIEAVEENVHDLIESVSRNHDALMALMKLRRFDDYTYTHSLNVSVLAISTGKTLGLGVTELRTLGLGTMFHDLGKSRIPGHILNKPGKLTDEEFAIMRNHAALSGDIIRDQKLKVDDMVHNIARHHHERIDGSGYPDSLKGQDAIPNLVTICGLSDVYDALSSDRIYHPGLSPHESLKFIYSLRGSHFQAEWVDRFVQSVGIYPPGTIIQLNSKQTAVVMEVDPASLQAPLVKIIADPSGIIYSRPLLLNLASEAEAKGLKIDRVVPSDEAGFNPSFYFNQPKE
jgi:HD-GYP domain-containing protein (c-di-GMP phosphodiesterase class II)